MAEELATGVANAREELLGRGGNADGGEAREGVRDVAFELLGSKVRISSVLILTPEAGTARALAPVLGIFDVARLVQTMRRGEGERRRLGTGFTGKRRSGGRSLFLTGDAEKRSQDRQAPNGSRDG